MPLLIPNLKKNGEPLCMAYALKRRDDDIFISIFWRPFLGTPGTLENLIQYLQEKGYKYNYGEQKKIDGSIVRYLDR